MSLSVRQVKELLDGVPESLLDRELLVFDVCQGNKVVLLDSEDVSQLFMSSIGQIQLFGSSFERVANPERTQR